MSPGIYWIGGGGVQIQSDGRLISKAVGDNTGTAPSGGVLIYNTADPAAAIVTGCVSAPTGPGCFGQVSINGGGGTPTMSLLPIETGTYTGMVMFLDRTKTTGGDDISLNGSNAVLNITGTIYAPKASVKLNGSNTSVVSAQIIAWSFQINGSGAGLTIDYAGAELFHLKGVGLVQ
jgi:hypothetical protein